MVLTLDGNAVKDAHGLSVLGYLVGLMHFVISKPVTDSDSVKTFELNPLYE